VGTVVNVTLNRDKQLHGSVFKTWRTTGQCAQLFRPRVRTDALVYTNTGGSIGGPILKDKLFPLCHFLPVSTRKSSTVMRHPLSIRDRRQPGALQDMAVRSTTQILANGGLGTGAANPNLCGTGRNASWQRQCHPLSNAGISKVWSYGVARTWTGWRESGDKSRFVQVHRWYAHQQFIRRTHRLAKIHQLRPQVGYNVTQKDHLSGRLSIRQPTLSRCHSSVLSSAARRVVDSKPPV